MSVTVLLFCFLCNSYGCASDLSSELFLLKQGNIPVILTAPHGGTCDMQCDTRKHGTIRADLNTLDLVKLVAEMLEKKWSLCPYVVGLRCKRKYIDVNRMQREAYEDIAMEQVYLKYHSYITNHIHEIKQQFPQNALLIDIHGQAYDNDSIFRGTRNRSTVQKLITTCGEEAFTGSTSILGALALHNYVIIPHNTSTENECPAYVGGFTVSEYGSHNLIGIDAIQLEFGGNLRKIDTINKTVQDLAEAIMVFHTGWQQKK